MGVKRAWRPVESPGPAVSSWWNMYQPLRIRAQLCLLGPRGSHRIILLSLLGAAG